MQSTYSSGLVWLRRDLRLTDNAALAAALQSCTQVHCVFILDRAILDRLPRADRRVEFIRESLAALDAQLRALGTQAHTGLIVRHGWAEQDIPALAQVPGQAKDNGLILTLGQSAIRNLSFLPSKFRVRYDPQECQSGHLLLSHG